MRTGSESEAAAGASSAYLAGGLSAVLIYRRRMSFRLRELVIPRWEAS